MTGDPERTGDSAHLEAIATATAPNKFTLMTVPIPTALPGTAFSVSDVVDIGGFNPNGDRLWTVASYNPSTGVITTVESSVTADPRAVDQWFNFTTGASTIATGPFVVGKPGVRGNRVMLDIVFPNGLCGADHLGHARPPHGQPHDRDRADRRYGSARRGGDQP